MCHVCYKPGHAFQYFMDTDNTFDKGAKDLYVKIVCRVPQKICMLTCGQRYKVYTSAGMRFELPHGSASVHLCDPAWLFNLCICLGVIRASSNGLRVIYSYIYSFIPSLVKICTVLNYHINKY